MKSLESKGEICKLLNIKYPIIQAGMIWVSGYKLAAAAANAGILGVIGAGSMKPDLLLEHIQKAKQLTSNPIAVNIPLIYHQSNLQIETAINAGVNIFITSAGSPKKYIKLLKDNNCKVIHVTSTPEQAGKCEDAGVDAVIAEGFEAGGHNGRDELTTMTLIPQVVDAVKIPVIAAGGIYDGRTTAAALCLGASAVQIGSRFVMATESSAHENFKQAILNAKATDTELSLKKLIPVRLLKNKFYQQVNQLVINNGSEQEFSELLSKGRAKQGMFEGDLDEGELEIGQIAGALNEILPTQKIVQNIISEYQNIVLSIS